MADEKRLVGSIPAAAVTPEMLANPGLMMSSPFFRTAAQIEAEPAVSEECDCCPCCGCTCGDEY